MKQRFGNASGLIRVIGSSGERVQVGSTGEMRTGEMYDHVSVVFEYGADLYNDCIETKTGTGSNSRLVSIVRLNSGASGTYALQSQDRIICHPGHAAFATLSFGLSVAPTNIQYVSRAQASDTKYNLNGSSTTSIDWTKIQNLQFEYGYYGALPIKVSLMRPNASNYFDIHTQYTHNTSTTTNMGSSRNPIRIEVSSTGVVRVGAFDVNDGIFLEFTLPAGSIYAFTAAWGGGILGVNTTDFGRPFAYPALTNVDVWTAVGTSLTNLVTFQNKALFQTRNNRIRSQLTQMSWISTGNDMVTLYIIGNATFTGTPTYVDFDTTNSVMAIAERVTAGAGGTNDIPVTGGRVLYRTFQYPQTGLGANPSSFSTNIIDMKQLGLYATQPLQTFTIAAKIASGTTAIRIALNWEEGQ